MKERPILYSTQMVRAAREGRKRQTRRTSGLEIINRDPDSWGVCDCGGKFHAYKGSHKQPDFWIELKCPYGQPGDRLWVREAWWPNTFGWRVLPTEEVELHYKADYDGKGSYFEDGTPPWKSGRFMFKKYARIWQDITNVRLERLQEISEADAIAEGVEMMHRPDGMVRYLEIYKGMPYWGSDARAAFHTAIWDPINAKRGYGWDKNQWVWVIEVKILPTHDVTSEK